MGSMLRNPATELCLAGLLLGMAGAVADRARATEDYRLETIIAQDFFSAEDMKRVRAGEVVQRNWSEFSERDISTSIAFLSRRPPAQVVRRVVDDFDDLRFDARVEQMRVLPADAGPEHFAGVVIDAAEAQRYLEARPGTKLNLSANEIERFAALRAQGGGREEVQAALRELLFERFRAYRKRGAAGIAPYARAGGTTLDIGSVLLRDIREERAHALTPHFRELMLAYPTLRDPGLQEQFVWIQYQQDGRPNFVLRHRMALQLGETWAVMERDFYVSHFYNAVQGFSALLPAEGGTLIFYGVRSNTEQARGMGARVRRALGRRIMTMQLVEMIEAERRSG